MPASRTPEQKKLAKELYGDENAPWQPKHDEILTPPDWTVQDELNFRGDNPDLKDTEFWARDITGDY